jgi:hypothetical protein
VSCLLASMGMLIWLTSTGIGLTDALLVTAAVGSQTLSGAYLWVWVRSRSGGSASSLEVLAMGFALGSFLAMAAGVLLRPVAPGGFGWAAPSVIALMIWLISAVKRRHFFVVGQLSSCWARRSVALGFVAGLLLGLAAVIVNLSRYPLHWTGAWNQYHPDMVFFEALANSIARFGPGNSIFMTGEDFRYHWFTYAWSGQLTDSLGLEPFVVLTRVLPVVTVLAAAAIAASWAGKYTKTIWVPGLAAVLITAGGYVGASYGTLLNFDSPSQALTSLWLLAFSFAVLEYLNGALSHRALWVVGALSIACMGGKANAAIVAVGAVGLLFLVGLIRRSPWRARAGWALLVSCVPAAVTYVLVLSGGANSGGLQVLSWANRASSVQGLDLGAGGLGIAAGTVILMLAVVPRWAGVVGLWLEPAKRWAPENVFAVGLVVMALAPLAILSQGVNELWFALTASAPLAVISAIGLGAAWESLSTRTLLEGPRRTVLLLVSAGLGLVLFAAASLLWRQGASGVVSVRALAPILVMVGAAVGALLLCWAFRPLLVGQGFALWVTVFITILVSASALGRATPLFNHSGALVSPAESAAVSLPGIDPSAPAIGVATVDVSAPSAAPTIGYDDNSWSDLEVAAARFLVSNTSDNDIIVTDRTSSWLIPALTGRLTFMSGALYQDLYGRASAVAAIPGRVGVSQRFASSPSQPDFDELCASGVTWGWFSPAAGNLTDEWAPFGEVAFENDAVRIVKLDQSRCSASN